MSGLKTGEGEQQAIARWKNFTEPSSMVEVLFLVWSMRSELNVSIDLMLKEQVFQWGWEMKTRRFFSSKDLKKNYSEAVDIGLFAGIFYLDQLRGFVALGCRGLEHFLRCCGV